jgi:hypothetical protein
VYTWTMAYTKNDSICRWFFNEFSFCWKRKFLFTRRS